MSKHIHIHIGGKTKDAVDPNQVLKEGYQETLKLLAEISSLVKSNYNKKSTQVASAIEKKDIPTAVTKASYSSILRNLKQVKSELS